MSQNTNNLIRLDKDSPETVLAFKCFVISALTASLLVAKRTGNASLLRESLFPIDFAIQKEGTALAHILI